VWAWLLGHYALAHYRVHGDAQTALRLLDGIAEHLRDAGLGSVSEILDGAAPHTPRGAPAQAWSVACTLEAWWRLEGTRTIEAVAAAAKTGSPSPTSRGRGVAPSPLVGEGRGEGDGGNSQAHAHEHLAITPEGQR
jgi:hypothetical protein